MLVGRALRLGLREGWFLQHRVNGDAEAGQGRIFKLSRDSPVQLFERQTKRIQRGENIPDLPGPKARTFSQ